jgi:tetratricopeptide (TPR) repeat protein
MELVREIGSLTLASVKEATREFLQPIYELGKWIRALLRMPGQLTRVSSLLVDQTGMLAKVDLLEWETESLFREMIPAWNSNPHYETYRELADLVQSTNYLDTFKYPEAERRVLKYLFIAEDFHRQGEIRRAGNMLMDLGRFGERHQLAMTLPYIWFNLGELSFEERNLDRAESYFQRIIGRLETHDIEEISAAAYARLAVLYYYQQDFDKTTDYAQRALEIFRQGSRENLLIQSYVQLAIVLIELPSENLIRTLEDVAETSGGIRFLLPDLRKLRARTESSP